MAVTSFPLTRPWKRGRRYGTILIDQVRHQVIDVLPDREADTLVKWLEDHPGAQIVSRDRAGAYADAVRRGHRTPSR